MANQSESGFLQTRGAGLELLLRDIEPEGVLFCGTRVRHTTLVACELNVPVAPRPADERSVVAVVSGEPAKLLKTQDIKRNVKTGGYLTHPSSYSHRRRPKRLPAHDSL